MDYVSIIFLVWHPHIILSCTRGRNKLISYHSLAFNFVNRCRYQNETCTNNSDSFKSPHNHLVGLHTCTNVQLVLWYVIVSELVKLTARTTASPLIFVTCHFIASVSLSDEDERGNIRQKAASECCHHSFLCL